MRKMKASEYKNDWEYEQAKREERKKDKKSREQKRGRKGIWQNKSADE